MQDSHPGSVSLLLQDMDDESVVESWSNQPYTQTVGWNMSQLGLYIYSFRAVDAYGNHCLGGGTLAVNPPACAPASQLSAELLDFGTVTQMGPVDLQFTLSNTSTGTCPDPITGVIAEECQAFRFSPTSYSLAQGESLTITVTFQGDHAGPTTCQVQTDHGAVACIVNDMVDAGTVATTFNLATPFPNPFNPTTTLRYSLPEMGNASLRIFDLTGALQATLVSGLQAAGVHEVQVDGSSWSSGVYVAVLEAAGQQTAQKLILSK